MDGYGHELREQVAAVYRGRRWICVTTTVEAARRLLNQVAGSVGIDPPSGPEEQAKAPLIGLAAYGTASEPDEGFPILSVDHPSSGDALADILAMPAVLHSSPPSLVAELDRWDPPRSARALVPSIMTDRPLAGRATFGARPPKWAALEDKLAVTGFWAAAGIETAPSELVGLDDRRALRAAHRRLAGRNGTVWAADNKRGMHGGAAGTHWVPTEEAVAGVAGRLEGEHDRVRVMPFLNGVPCSIHGIVLPHRTVTTRPNEMLVYVDQSEHRFCYSRFANHWDPPDEDREAMVAAAISVGDSLRSTLDFRGVFSLDGILTTGGFRPTEINPRFGMALPFTLPVATPPDRHQPAGEEQSVDLILLDKAIIAGELRPDVDKLQAWLVDALDQNRRGAAFFVTKQRPEAPRSGRVAAGPDGELTLLPAEDNGVEAVAARSASLPQPEPATLATVAWPRPGTDRGLAVTLAADFPVGPPAAPEVLRLARFVDSHWEIGLAELTPALAL